MRMNRSWSGLPKQDSFCLAVDSARYDRFLLHDLSSRIQIFGGDIGMPRREARQAPATREILQRAELLELPGAEPGEIDGDVGDERAQFLVRTDPQRGSGLFCTVRWSPGQDLGQPSTSGRSATRRIEDR